MTPGWVQAVKAPNGIARAEVAPAVHLLSNPCDSAADNASRAILLFPTPAAPDTTTPEASGAAIEDAMALIDPARPVSGQDKRTEKA